MISRNVALALLTTALATATIALTFTIAQNPTQEIQYETDEWTRGFNSAVRQFAPIERISEMTVKTESYTAKDHDQKNEGTYADGYHSALDILTRENSCPR